MRYLFMALLAANVIFLGYNILVENKIIQPLSVLQDAEDKNGQNFPEVLQLVGK